MALLGSTISSEQQERVVCLAATSTHAVLGPIIDVLVCQSASTEQWEVFGVGLRLLLCPFGSNVVIRTACCSVGIVLPVYSTFKAIENKDQNEQQKWLLYWTAYGSFSLAEVFADKILYWFPLYYHMKFAFLVWLQLPSADGAKHLYMNHLRPFLLRHQARLDQVLGFVYGEMVKFISAHQAEIQFAKGMLVKILGSANQMLSDIIHPVKPRGQIEGPTKRIQDSESDHED